MVIIGDKSAAEHLVPILIRLSRNEYIFIKTLTHPQLVAKVVELYELLKPFGVLELEGDTTFVYESLRGNPDKSKIMVKRWHVIPRLLKYRSELKDG